MSEYLVEVTPGRELLYRTPLALRGAMRSGEINPDSRIYHRAAARWISIVEHPEYRKFLAERRPPDWLEPIPFEPARPEPEPARTRRHRVDLGARVRRVRDRLRAWLARPAEPKAPEPRPPTARPSRVRGSRPADRGSEQAGTSSHPRGGRTFYR